MFCESGQSFCQAIKQRKPNFWNIWNNSIVSDVIVKWFYLSGHLSSSLIVICWFALNILFKVVYGTSIDINGE